jgi:hypothetical protein
VKVLSSILVAALLTVTTWAQTPGSRPPRFEDYPVKDIFAGTPAAPKIVTPIQRKYRTRIREGVEKGWGVFQGGFQNGKEQDHPGPNFAGRMIVVQWGCGSPCLMMAMVDAVTGDVYLPPLSFASTFALPLSCIGSWVPSNPDIALRQDSRLMVIKATPDCSHENHCSYAYYYVWQDNRWILVYRERLD